MTKGGDKVWTAMDKLMYEIYQYLAFMDLARESATLRARLDPYTLHRWAQQRESILWTNRECSITHSVIYCATFSFRLSQKCRCWTSISALWPFGQTICSGRVDEPRLYLASCEQERECRYESGWCVPSCSISGEVASYRAILWLPYVMLLYSSMYFTLRLCDLYNFLTRLLQ